MELTTLFLALLSLVACSTQMQIGRQTMFPRRPVQLRTQQSFGGNPRSFGSGAGQRGAGIRTRVSVQTGQPGRNINIIKQTILVHPGMLSRPTIHQQQHQQGSQQISGPSGPATEVLGVTHAQPHHNSMPSAEHHGQSVGAGAHGPVHDAASAHQFAHGAHAPGSHRSGMFAPVFWRPSSQYLHLPKFKTISLPILHLSPNGSLIEHMTSGMQQNGGQGKQTSAQQLIVLPNGKNTQPIVIAAHSPSATVKAGQKDALGAIIVVNSSQSSGGLAQNFPTTLAPGEDPPESNLPESNHGEA